MKKIIALRGKGNTGKTTTLLNLIELLKNYKLMDSKNRKTDKTVVIEIKGKKLGITTRGDNKQALEEDFAFMEGHKCDLYVCACRSGGETVKFLENQCTDGQPIYHGKWYIDPKKNDDIKKDIEVANESQAKLIYAEILRII